MEAHSPCISVGIYSSCKSLLLQIILFVSANRSNGALCVAAVNRCVSSQSSRSSPSVYQRPGLRLRLHRAFTGLKSTYAMHIERKTEYRETYIVGLQSAWCVCWKLLRDGRRTEKGGRGIKWEFIQSILMAQEQHFVEGCSGGKGAGCGG